MSGMTFVVYNESAGAWVMDCIDPDAHEMLCESVYEEFPTKAAAERAATAHRRQDAAERVEREAKWAMTCRTCGAPRC